MFLFDVSKDKSKASSLGGLEPPTFRLTAERANRLRHRDNCLVVITKSQYTGNDSVIMRHRDFTKFRIRAMALMHHL